MVIPMAKCRITWITQSTSRLMLPAVLCQRNSTHCFATPPIRDRHDATIVRQCQSRVEQGAAAMLFQVVFHHHFKNTCKRALRRAGHGSNGGWIHHTRRRRVGCLIDEGAGGAGTGGAGLERMKCTAVTAMIVCLLLYEGPYFVFWISHT